MSSELEFREHLVPTFSQPDEDAHFLASARGLYTYSHLARFERFLLQFLNDYGYDPGGERPVGFLSHSSDELIFALAACWRLGFTFCCVDANAAPSEQKKQLERLNPGLLFYDQEHMDQAPVTGSVPMSNLKLEEVLERTFNMTTSVEKRREAIDTEDVFAKFLTSGTSGPPKIVPLKRRQMLYAARASARNFRPDPGHFWLLCLPLNHVGGISIVLRSLLYGSGIYRMDGFDQEMVSTFLNENTLFQAASLVPTMLKRLLEIPAFRTHRGFKAILLGGGPIDPALLRQATEKGIPIVPSYGMTETCAQIAANHIQKPSGVYVPFQSVGAIFAPNEMEIRDREGEKVPPNDSGTIWLRGPQVFDGYLDDGEGGASAAGDGDDAPSRTGGEGSFDAERWFNTGDYGHLNIHGQLIVEARRTDLIITGGENVSPHEVESALVKLEGIAEAAVIGLPDEEWGQRVVAAVVTRDGKELDPEAVREALGQNMSEFKIPKELLAVDALPHTPSGKIKRKDVIALFKSNKS
ncbi:MAG: class I adenylate-forming enzyme family protein [Balneolaceae bacterium]|nr:class I adenylate-forming enzyme family protein [Balneolaceae bacterium]